MANISLLLTGGKPEDLSLYFNLIDLCHGVFCMVIMIAIWHVNIPQRNFEPEFNSFKLICFHLVIMSGNYKIATHQRVDTDSVIQTVGPKHKGQIDTLSILEAIPVLTCMPFLSRRRWQSLVYRVSRNTQTHHPSTTSSNSAAAMSRLNLPTNCVN